MLDFPPHIFEDELLLRGALIIVTRLAMRCNSRVVLVFGQARCNRFGFVFHRGHRLVR